MAWPIQAQRASRPKFGPTKFFDITVLKYAKLLVYLKLTIRYNRTCSDSRRRPTKYGKSVETTHFWHVLWMKRYYVKWLSKSNEDYFFLFTWVYLVVWNNVMLKKVANFVHVETSWGKVGWILSKREKWWRLKLADCTAVKSCWYLWS